jgi:2-polyprenyl-3-methyl-5-hydroxy-6-metoxy-1,4-benzoquinol methylase
MHCIICKKKKFELIWNDKIRCGLNKFSKKKEKIFKCSKCHLVFLKNRRKDLEDSAFARNIFNKNNSVEEFYKFHKQRELNKLNKFNQFISFSNKDILESNCGAGLLLSLTKNIAKCTYGIDSEHYKDHIERNGHKYFSSIDEAIFKKKKFDLILSLSELEHKYDPIAFLKKIKKILKIKGRLVLRVPNFLNLYAFLLDKSFYKYDFRTSHNYYYSENNLDMLFKKLKFKEIKKIGYQEYNFNHLLEYVKTKKRVEKKYSKILSTKNLSFLQNNIEKNMLSTSLIYILKK